MSTHWPGIFATKNNPAPQTFFEYLKEKLPAPASHKLYFDYETKTLDAMYAPYQSKADEVVPNAGFDSLNFRSPQFIGHSHTERDWHKRLHIPLTFLISEQ